MGNTVTKAKLLIEGEDPMQVEFNPSEYSLTNGIQYSEKNVPGLDGPIGQYICGNSTTLNVTFYFNTYNPPTLDNPQEGGTDVTKYTKKIVNLTQMNGKLHRVPKVTFSWGSIKFIGIITDVKESYTMFLTSGMPVRAKLDVTFKSVYNVADKKRVSPFESPDRTKARVFTRGDALWSIAAQEYGDPKYWRVIAKENKILNPLEIAEGRVLKLPPL